MNQHEELNISYRKELYLVKLDEDGRVLEYNTGFRIRYNLPEYPQNNCFFWDVTCIGNENEFKRTLNNCVRSPGLTVRFPSENTVWELFAHYNARGSHIINCLGEEDANYRYKNQFNTNQSDHILKAVFETTNHFKIFIHPDLKLVFFNKRAFHLMKVLYDIELQTGDNVTEIIRSLEDDVREPIQESLLAAFNGQDVVREQRILNGTELWYQQLYHPVYSDDKLVGVSVIIIDITGRKIHEEKIRAQNTKLREIAFHQCHSVRRPLANIKGLLSLLDGQNLNEEQKMILQKLNQSCEELDEIIRQTVQASRETEILPNPRR